VNIRDDRLSRSFMFLCVGAALMLVGIQWFAWAANSQNPPGILRRSAWPTKANATSQTGVDAAAIARSDARLVVSLSERRVSLYRDQQLIKSYPVAIGQAGWETPRGSFHVFEMQRNPEWRHPITGEVIPPGPDNPLGQRWIGFLIDGRTHVGFHGTNQEDLIGQAVSHGCIRMRNQDVVAMYDQVALGTTVEVRP